MTDFIVGRSYRCIDSSSFDLVRGNYYECREVLDIGVILLVNFTYGYSKKCFDVNNYIEKSEDKKEMSEFIIGRFYKCIDDSRTARALNKGEYYKITEILREQIRLEITGTTFNKSRFDVNDFKEKVEQKESPSDFIVGQSYKCIDATYSEVPLVKGDYYKCSVVFTNLIKIEGIDDYALNKSRFDVNDVLVEEKDKSIMFNVIEQSKDKLDIGFIPAQEVTPEYIIPGLFIDKDNTVIMIISYDKDKEEGKGFVVSGNTKYQKGMWSNSWNMPVLKQTFGEVRLNFQK